MTKTETILSTIASVLLAANIGASVERDRTAPFDIDALPGVVIKPKNEESSPLATGLTRCLLQVEIEIHTRGTAPSTLADPILEKVNAALLASAPLAGLIAKLYRSGKDWEFSDSDSTAGKLVITYQIHFFESA